MKKVFAMFAFFLLLLNMTSCKKDDVEDVVYIDNTEYEQGDYTFSEDENAPKKDGEGELDASEQQELIIDDEPEIVPLPEKQENEPPVKHIEIVVEGESFDMAIDNFYKDENYQYYFPSMQSDSTFVIIDGVKYPIKECLAQKKASIKELTDAGLVVYKVKVGDEAELLASHNLELKVLYSDEGILAGTADVEGTEYNVLVYAENTDGIMIGDTVFIDYKFEQLIDCDEEFVYTDLDGNEQSFKAQKKLIEAEIYIE